MSETKKHCVISQVIQKNGSKAGIKSQSQIAECHIVPNTLDNSQTEKTAKSVI